MLLSCLKLQNWVAFSREAKEWQSPPLQLAHLQVLLSRTPALVELPSLGIGKIAKKCKGATNLELLSSVFLEANIFNLKPSFNNSFEVPFEGLIKRKLLSEDSIVKPAQFWPSKFFTSKSAAAICLFENCPIAAYGNDESSRCVNFTSYADVRKSEKRFYHVSISTTRPTTANKVFQNGTVQSTLGFDVQRTVAVNASVTLQVSKKRPFKF